MLALDYGTARCGCAISDPTGALVPKAEVQLLNVGTNAALITAERGSAWTLIHPELSVVVPQPNPIRIPLAFAVGRRDAGFAAFLNSWIELKRQDGTLDLLYRHWILGADAVARQPRWSIMRDILHWVR